MYVGIGHEIIFPHRGSEQKYNVIVFNLIYHFKISYAFLKYSTRLRYNKIQKVFISNLNTSYHRIKTCLSITA